MKIQELYNKLNKALERRGWGPMTKEDFTVMISQKSVAGEIKIINDDIFDVEKKE